MVCQSMDYFHSICPGHVTVALPDQTKCDPGPSDGMETKKNIDICQFNLRDELSRRVDESIREIYPEDNSNYALLHTHANTMEGQNILIGYDQYSINSMRFNNMPWSATKSCDVDPTVPKPFTWANNAHEISDSFSISPWTSEKQESNQFSSIHSTPELSRNVSIMTQDVSLLDPNTSRSTSQLPEYNFLSDMTRTEQGEVSSTMSGNVVRITDLDDAVTRIGSVLNNGKFVCDNSRCAGRTFARQAELRRHYTTIHASNRPSFWCPVSSCRRSMSAGGEAFHRKDKLMAHIRSMHPDEQ